MTNKQPDIEMRRAYIKVSNGKWWQFWVRPRYKKIPVYGDFEVSITGERRQ